MSDVDQEQREGWLGLGKWWLVSAIFMLVVVLGLVYVLVAPDHKNSTKGGNGNQGVPTSIPTDLNPSSSGPSTSSSSPAPVGWADPGCFGSPGNGDVPYAAPSDVTWDPVGGSSVPRSSKTGPAKVDGALRHCYQHSPTGALFAAVTIPAAIGSVATNSAAAAPIVDAEVLPGPARDALLSGGSSDSWAENVAAYKFNACAADRCNIDLVVSATGSGSSGVLARSTFSVVWSGGDWKLDASTLGASSVDAVPTGFTAWAPGA